MSALKRVETQPYYMTPGRGEVWDARFVLPNMVPPIKTDAYEFASEPIPFENMREGHVLRRGEGFVHGLTQKRYAGSDGETHSGFIELVEVLTTGEPAVGVMRSWQFSHETGMPAKGCSWMLEFTDMSVAEAFWKYASPKFHDNNALEDLRNMLADNPEINPDTVSFTELGLLSPWYLQRAKEPGHRVGKIIVDDKNFEQADPALHTGKVYRLPERDWYSTKVRGYTAKTCLGSVAIKERAGMFGNEVVPVTLIQWDDGSMTRHKDDEPLPEALTTHGLKAPIRPLRTAE